jgi:uncharacterized damage-inducible protein DinB
MGKIIGSITLAMGVILMAASLFTDIGIPLSKEVSDEISSLTTTRVERVANIGLMAMQQILFQFGYAMMLFGTITLAASNIINAIDKLRIATKANTPDANTSPNAEVIVDASNEDQTIAVNTVAFDRFKSAYPLSADELSALAKEATTNPGIANAKDISGNTLLHIAAHANHHEAVTLLLAAGANSVIPNSRGFSPAQITTDQRIIKALEDALMNVSPSPG